MGHPHTALRHLCRYSPLLPDEGWDDPDAARRRVSLASGGEAVMIQIALSLWLGESVRIDEIGRLDHANASAVLGALAILADHEEVLAAALRSV